MALSGKPDTSRRRLAQAPKTGATRPATYQPGYRPVGLAQPKNPVLELPIRTATAWSVGVHVASPFVLALLTALVLLLLSWLLNMDWRDWFKPKEAPKDLVFTLVEDTGAERPEKPLLKGEFNQAAGGKTDPDQPIAPDNQPMQQQAASTPPTPAQQQVQPQESVTPKPKQQPVPEQKPAAKAAIKTPAKPSPPQSSPSTQAPTPSPQQTAIASSGTPSTAPAFGRDGAFGNPQGGPNPDAGVDVMADANFGPFMNDLQKRIKRNWNPPRGTENQQVKLLFEISRDGRLVKVDVVGSSGNTLADEAAVRAVQASAPFRPFPPEVRDEVLPIEFTFDYNVFNPSQRAFKR